MYSPNVGKDSFSFRKSSLYTYLKNIYHNFIEDIEINDIIHCLKTSRRVVIIRRPGTQLQCF